jgi:hypothetical protein
MKQRRIPIAYIAFNQWKNNTNNFLQSDDPANPGHKQWERLGLTLAESAAWAAETLAWNALYAKYSDKDQKTLSIIRQCRDMKFNLIEGNRGIVNRIAASPVATEQDATVFNFVLVRKEPTRRTGKITQQIFAGVDRSGSTEYTVQCRYDKDTKRPSLLVGSDGVEVAYKISNTQPADPATVDPNGEGFRQRTYGKARFVFEAGTANKGKFLLIAFRWNFSPNTAFNGPWTEVTVVVIS